jgi:hypothetical protein
MNDSAPQMRGCLPPSVQKQLRQATCEKEKVAANSAFEMPKEKKVNGSDVYTRNEH